MNHVNETWQEIAGAIEFLSGLAKQPVSQSEFETQFVDRLTILTAANAGALWRCAASLTEEAISTEPVSSVPTASAWQIVYQYQTDASSNFGSASQRFRLDSITLAIESATNHVSSHGNRSLNHNSASPLVDVACKPVVLDSTVVAVIELIFPTERSPAVCDATKHLLDVASEIAAEFYRNWDLRRLRDREQRRQQFDRFVHSIYQSYELDRVSCSVATEGREVLKCDRLTVLMRQRNQYKTAAVSGVETLDSRSQTLNAIERLVQQHALQSHEPIWLEAAESNMNISSAKDYFSDTNAAWVGIVPLTSKGSPLGQHKPFSVLVVEVFHRSENPEETLLPSRTQWIALHAASALSNAASINSLPLLGINRWVERNLLRGKRLSRWAGLGIAVSSIIACLCLIPADFMIDARGELQPDLQELVFAPRSGIITGLPAIEDSHHGPSAKQGIAIRAGDVVVQLENSDLEYQWKTLLGERATTDQELDTVSISLERAGRSNDSAERNRFDELTAKSLELRVQKESIEKRIALLQSEREDLSIKAGMTGQLMTWNVAEELMLRPVQQGDQLMQIVDVAGPWHLELYVPDRHIGYVQSAQAQSVDPLKLTFVLKSNPQNRYDAVVQQVAISTELYDEYGAAIRVIGKIESPDMIKALRPGTTVIAKIACGQKPLGYVWLYDLIDTIRMKLLF